MVKHINGWEISKCLQSDCKVYVKQFSGTKTKCMKDYTKPSLRENLDHFILHVGTNDLNTERSPELIEKSIADLATTLKGNSRDVSVSNIIARDDNSSLNETGCEVNAYLKEMCQERKLNLINHLEKIKPNHLNRGNLERIQKDKKGSKVLGEAFLKEISVFHGHYSDEDSRLNHEGCKSKFLLEDKKRIDAKTILKSIRQEHTNKLVFAHININSLRNKFELLVDQVK